MLLEDPSLPFDEPDPETHEEKKLGTPFSLKTVSKRSGYMKNSPEMLATKTMSDKFTGYVGCFSA